MLILGTEFLEQTHRTELELKLDVRNRCMEHNWKENTIEQNAQFVEWKSRTELERKHDVLNRSMEQNCNGNTLEPGTEVDTQPRKESRLFYKCCYKIGDVFII